MALTGSYEFFHENTDPATSVRLLPDLLQVSPSKSIVVEKVSKSLYDKYATKLTEYENGLKEISESVERSISHICEDYLRADRDVIREVGATLSSLNHETSSEQFHDTWKLISETATTMFKHANQLYERFVSAEHGRLNQIREHMQGHFLSVNRDCHRNNLELDAFFNEESKSLNECVIRNYKHYRRVVSEIKLSVVDRLKDWHISWVVKLSTWRDNLTRQNIKKISDLSRDERFLAPQEVLAAKEAADETLNGIESMIQGMLDRLAREMPLSLDLATKLLDSVGVQLGGCSDVVSQYSEYSIDIYRQRFTLLYGHIEFMKNFLRSNVSIDKNESIELFENAVYDIFLEYEENVNSSQNAIIDSLSREIEQKHRYCNVVKDYTARVATHWDGYLAAFEVAETRFRDSVQRIRKNHNNRVLWMERALDRDVQLLTDSKTTKNLEKRIVLIESDLEKLMNEYNKYTDEMEDLIRGYVESRKEEDRAAEKEFLDILALVKVADSDSAPVHGFTVPGGGVYLRSDVANDEYDCVTTFKDTCSKFTFLAFLNVQASNLQTVEANAEAGLNQAKIEIELRKDVHQSRFKKIKEEEFATREAAIEAFRERVDFFWDEVTCGERKYTKLFQELCQETERIVEEFKSEMTALNDSVLSLTTSAELMAIAPQISVKQESSKMKLEEVISEFQSDILLHKAFIREQHLKLMQYADQNNLKFANNLKIKNEFDEFSELAQDMAVRAGKEHAKTETIIEQGGISLSHYKRTLFCVFYLERRAEILKHVKLKIKSEAVASIKEMSLFEKAVAKFSPVEEIKDPLQLHHQLDTYTKLYTQARTLLNIFNYSSGVGDVAEPCVSMDRLNRRYERFNRGGGSNFDISFIKEIMAAAKKTDKPGDVSPKTDTNWKTSRSLIVKDFVAGRVRSRYGVGVRLEPAPINPKIQRLKEHMGSNMKGFWLRRALENTKKDSNCSKEEHTAIVHSACSKLKERSNSRVGKKNLEQLRYYLPQLADMGSRRSNSPSGSRSSSPRGLSRASTLRNSTMGGISTGRTSPRLSNNTPRRPSSVQSRTSTMARPSSVQGQTSTMGRHSPGRNSTVPGTASKKESLILPAITSASKYQGRRSPGIGKKSSNEQADMDKTISLIRTAEYLMKSDSVASSNKELSVYDFNKTDDLVMREMLFDPVGFFNLKQRAYDIDIVTKIIVSVSEKTKLHMRHTLEEFVIMSEIFFRQKNLVIPKKGMPKDPDEAAKTFEMEVQKNLRKVTKFCDEGVEKVKKIVFKLNVEQLLFSARVFTSIATFHENGVTEIKTQFEVQFRELTGSVDAKKRFFFCQLKPALSHPENHGTLHNLDEQVAEMISRAKEELSETREDLFEQLKSIKISTLGQIEEYKVRLYKLADSTIIPGHVRRINRNNFKGVVHQACLNVPELSPRALHALFSEGGGEVEQLETKLYSRVANESARAIVRVSRLHDQVRGEVAREIQAQQVSADKWLDYWRRNVEELKESFTIR